MSKWEVPFVRRVPDYTVEGDNIIISVDGEGFCAFTIRDFERGAIKAARVIAAHRAKRAEVIPIRKRGSHAARS